MANQNTSELISQYFDAFNAKDLPRFLSLLSEDVIHDINQGETEIGIPKFKQFMDRSYTVADENVKDLIILTSDDGRYACARFSVVGKYLQSLAGFPAAHGQSYQLPVTTFFEIKDQAVMQVSTYYNMQDWIKQVK